MTVTLREGARAKLSLDVEVVVLNGDHATVSFLDSDLDESEINWVPLTSLTPVLTFGDVVTTEDFTSLTWPAGSVVNDNDGANTFKFAKTRNGSWLTLIDDGVIHDNDDDLAENMGSDRGFVVEYIPA